MKTLIQKLLRESLNEISLNQNIQHDFDIEVDSQGNAYSLGDDGQGNDLDMIMKRLPTDESGNPCDSCYEFSYSFNQAMVQDTKSTARHFLQVLGIVRQGFEQMFRTVNPSMVILNHTDKDGKAGQKMRINNNLLKQSAGELNSMGYDIRDHNGSIIIKKNQETQTSN